MRSFTEEIYNYLDKNFDVTYLKGYVLWINKRTQKFFLNNTGRAFNVSLTEDVLIFLNEIKLVLTNDEKNNYIFKVDDVIKDWTQQKLNFLLPVEKTIVTF